MELGQLFGRINQESHARLRGSEKEEEAFFHDPQELFDPFPDRQWN